jgi:hypothetical protein
MNELPLPPETSSNREVAILARDAELAQLRRKHQRLVELVTWISACIPRRNANGIESEQFCLLCYRGIPVTPASCRHGEIRAIAAEGVKRPLSKPQE